MISPLETSQANKQINMPVEPVSGNFESIVFMSMFVSSFDTYSVSSFFTVTRARIRFWRVTSSAFLCSRTCSASTA